uniref:hypothetical protein n=1 Tax=Crenothrix polyspora TaxID=360316 RepID=UPI0015C68E0B|nr:hypothetical protein [Crenothrix polyspora]
MLKKYLLPLLLALSVNALSPMATATAAGKTENASTEEVRQALVDSVKAAEDALTALKSGASEEAVNEHISNARQLIKRVEINRLDVIRTRSAESLKKARQALNNGQKDLAEDFLANALKGFKEMQSVF